MITPNQVKHKLKVEKGKKINIESYLSYRKHKNKEDKKEANLVHLT